MPQLTRPWTLAIAGTLAIATTSPAMAQVRVQGGSIIFTDVQIYVPDAPRNNPVSPNDPRAVVYESTIPDGGVIIRTEQGDLPTNLLFRRSTLPTLDTTPNTQPVVGDTGNVLGTVTFRGFSAAGEPTLFTNIPTNLDFRVSRIVGPTLTGALNEHQTDLFLLTETGFTTSPSSVGVVQRNTPVVLVQYNPGAPTDQVVLNNNVPASAYIYTTPGKQYDAPMMTVELTDGTLDIPTPPGFSPNGTTNTTPPTPPTINAPDATFILAFTANVVFSFGNAGSSQIIPIMPIVVVEGVFLFVNVPSGVWFDPPATEGFEFEMRPNQAPIGLASRVFPGMVGREERTSLFTEISGLPTGIDGDDRFTVSVDGKVLGEFSSSQTVKFSDYREILGDSLVRGAGVAKFTISGINPAVDGSNPRAFPVKLDFNTPTASFEMRAIGVPTAQAPSSNQAEAASTPVPTQPAQTAQAEVEQPAIASPQ